MNRKFATGLGLALMLTGVIGLGDAVADAVSGIGHEPSADMIEGPGRIGAGDVRESRPGSRPSSARVPASTSQVDSVEPEEFLSYQNPILINPSEMVADIYSSEVRQLRGRMVDGAFRALDLPSLDTAPRWDVVGEAVVAEEFESRRVGVRPDSS